MTTNALENYYIVNRISGHSFEIAYIIEGKFAIATSNVATHTRPFTIVIPKLIKGLAERRYRLTPKNIQ